MKFLFIIFCIVFSGISCINSKNMQAKNSPLATVIKLHAAEFLMDYSEAKNYIDVNSVYRDKDLRNGLSPEQAWVEMVSFMANSTDKKFTRQFKYYDYDIIEIINGNRAEVIFKPKIINNKGISYKMELRKDNWIIYEIDYKS